MKYLVAAATLAAAIALGTVAHAASSTFEDPDITLHCYTRDIGLTERKPVNDPDGFLVKIWEIRDEGVDQSRVMWFDAFHKAQVDKDFVEVYFDNEEGTQVVGNYQIQRDSGRWYGSENGRPESYKSGICTKMPTRAF